MSLLTNRHKVVLNGHWQGELWGLATQQSSNLFYTVGEDNLVACWNAEKCQLVNSSRLDFPARCIDIASNGKFLAVGCLNGTILILDSKGLVVVYTLKDRDSSITCLKFSPDNEILVVCFSEPSCEIIVYDSKSQFKQISKMRGSSSSVTHLDFSQPPKRIIQCNNSGNELLYFDLLEKNKTGSLGK